MGDNMDNTRKTQDGEEQANKTIQVTEVGEVCVFCGKDYATEDFEVGCCGEIRHEVGYETEDGDLILESELTNSHNIKGEA